MSWIFSICQRPSYLTEQVALQNKTLSILRSIQSRRNPAILRAFAIFLSFEEKLNKKFSLLLGKLSEVTEKQKTLEGKVANLQNELNILKLKANQRNGEFFLRA